MAGATERALVVLGCKVLADGTPSSAAERRLLTAARSFAAGPFELVITSGGRRWNGHAEADVFAARLVALGVPRSHIVRELCSLSTLENAAYTSRLLRERGIVDATIVTCDVHGARAARCFSWMGLRVSTVLAPTPATGPSRAYRAAGEWVRGHLDGIRAAEWVR
jgi:uncharacterized SAM-binding protein YcdF (DUF218 family)